MIANFAAWCVQVAAVVALGSLAPWLFGLKKPNVRLWYWHVLLAVCLILPLVEPWRPAAVVVRGEVSATTGPTRIIDDGATAPREWKAEEILAGLLGGGALLRLLWLCGGLVRLRGMRRSGEPLPALPVDAERAMKQLGVSAELLVSSAVTSPVTFGASHPVILLPAGFNDLPAEKCQPVILHELLHIARRDWLWAIGEELVRCALWFHPAIWWLLGRIQLTREQVVDHSVVEWTQSRQQYVDALLAVAASRLKSDLAPAPLFLKKRHLRQRVVSISEEVTMSKAKLLLSSLAVFSTLPLVVGIAAWQFPLNAAPQEVRDAPGVEVKGDVYKLLHRTGIAYPADAREKGIGGAVVVRVTVDAKGKVTDAQVVSGPEELRRAVLTSVLDWHFSTEPWQVNGTSRPMPQQFEIAVGFAAGAPPQPKLPAPQFRQQAERAPMTIERVDLSSLPAPLRDRVQQLNLPREGDTVAPERLAQLADDLRAVDEHLAFATPQRDGKMTVRVMLRPTGDVMEPQRIRVGGNVQAVNLVKKVTPLYPPEAKQAGVQGLVRMTAVIDKEGKVSSLESMEGHPLLVAAAMESVKQWEYKPTLLNGNPVEVTTTIDVNFTLVK